MNRGQIYALFDKKADELTGGLHIHKHKASAIRFFCDVLADKETAPGQHPEDYDLYMLGVLNETSAIEAQSELILTGEQWLATQKENATNAT